MGENLKLFLETVSKKPEIVEELREAAKLSDDQQIEKLIEIASAQGMNLEQADFELDLEELDAAAGGDSPCSFTGTGIPIPIRPIR